MVKEGALNVKTSSQDTLGSWSGSLAALSCALMLGFGATLSACTVYTQPVTASGGVYAEAGPAPVADETVYPSAPPPDPVPESPPPAPGPGYIWANGNWDWTGSEWSWNSGYWAPEQPGYVYIGPRFEFVEGRPVYYRSYWRGPGGRREYGYGGRGAPPAAWRARPASDPVAWRGEPAHNQAWHSSPGAEKWHGNATASATVSREPEHPENHAEPTRTEPARTEPARTEPTRTEPTRTEPTRTEPTRKEPTTHADTEHALTTAASKPPAEEAERRSVERPNTGNAAAPAAHAPVAAKGAAKRPPSGKKTEKKE
jgi:WXXGXW repeat (2 copies)